MPDTYEFDLLKKLSQKIGQDPLQIQAAGGNTSIKTDKLMWIKASGTWLANACSDELFVPVSLNAVREAMKNNDPRAEKPMEFIEQSLNPEGLRPSIETTVHAAMPQKVVVHIHCVDTISIAIQQDGEAQLTERLRDFNWLWVPYFRPGLPLSKYIASAISSEINVVVLGNHGLIVAADTVEAAEQLLSQVRSALRQEVRQTKPPEINTLTALASSTSYQPARSIEAHDVAMDHELVNIAAGGSMYPDHVIFLGAECPVANGNRSIEELANNNRDENNAFPPFIIVPALGVLMHETANESQQALARCLADVCKRLPDSAELNYLTDQQVYELTHWEAETYRQTLSL